MPDDPKPLQVIATKVETDHPEDHLLRAAASVVRTGKGRTIVSVGAYALLALVLGGGGFQASATIERKLDVAIEGVSSVRQDMASLRGEVATLKVELGAFQKEDYARRVRDLERSSDRAEERFKSLESKVPR